MNHHIFEGTGADWSDDQTMTPEEITESLRSLTDEERFELGCSAWHMRKATEREIAHLRIRRLHIEHLQDCLALADHDGDTAWASRLRMEIAAAQLGEEIDAFIGEIRTVDDLKALVADREYR